jgi:hypothetical protein
MLTGQVSRTRLMEPSRMVGGTSLEPKFMDPPDQWTADSCKVDFNTNLQVTFRYKGLQGMEMSSLDPR